MNSLNVPQTTPRVVALIAAAGKGTRLGAELPKAYVPLRGKTLLERSINAMLTAELIDEIVVIVSSSMSEYARELLAKRNLIDRAHIVHGGGERADSVWAGLQSIDATNAVVLVHDAARALTPPGMIARVVKAVLDGSPAVIPVLPVTDTIKRVDGEKVIDTPSRSSLRAVQTPQGFDLASLREANARYFASSEPGFVATDDASLMEWAGYPVRCVVGDPMAFKVTTPVDFALAKAVVDEAEPTIFEIPGGCS